MELQLRPAGLSLSEVGGSNCTRAADSAEGLRLDSWIPDVSLLQGTGGVRVPRWCPPASPGLQAYRPPPHHYLT